jgi:hypothetical protein
MPLPSLFSTVVSKSLRSPGRLPLLAQCDSVLAVVTTQPGSDRSFGELDYQRNTPFEPSTVQLHDL